jgi:tetratricopeptide (TPR) repeat protein
LLFFVVSWALGSPPVLLLILLFLADSFYFRWGTALLRRVRRGRRERRLRSLLAINPHDRRARHELATLLLQRGRHAGALELLKANVEAGEHDPETLLLIGQACFGAGYPQPGEVFLGEARASNAGHSMGAADLELGRGRLLSKDSQGALEPLRRFCEERPGTVEGRILLAQASERTGDRAGARRLRRQAWAAWWHAPGFVRKRDRRFAFSLHPAPFIVVGALLVAGCLWLAVSIPGLFLRGAVSAMRAQLPGQERLSGDEIALASARQLPRFSAQPVDVEAEGGDPVRLNYQLAALLDGRRLEGRPPAFVAGSRWIPRASSGSSARPWCRRPGAASLRAVRPSASATPQTASAWWPRPRATPGRRSRCWRRSNRSSARMLPHASS